MTTPRDINRVPWRDLTSDEHEQILADDRELLVRERGGEDPKPDARESRRVAVSDNAHCPNISFFGCRRGQ